jgi:hypothetical protein
MTNIYKINVLEKNVISKIYVFIGFVEEGESYKQFVDNVENGGEYIINDKHVFDDFEMANIRQNKIPIVVINDAIYKDDNVYSIKLKLLKHIQNKSESDFSLEEIYLFCSKPKILNATIIYDSLTLIDNNITKHKLSNVIFNIENSERIIESIPDKNDYNYDDIKQMVANNPLVNMNNSIGQKIFLNSNEYPYIVNPYQVNKKDAHLETVHFEVTILNNQLLFNSAEFIHNNNIYVCFAENILQGVDENIQEYMCKIYFPLLYKKNIVNLDLLISRQEEIRQASNDKLTPFIDHTFESISMFHGVYNNRINDFEYVSVGIKKIQFTLKPEREIKIPLNVIFKLIHATKNNPLIKYNISEHQDNIYRLYSEKITNDGIKIPFLERALIFKLMRNIGRQKSVSVYIEYKLENSCFIICEFEENGNIVVFADFDEIMKINDNFEKINQLFIKAINPIIESIQQFFEQNGYKISNFKSLLDDNVEINDLNYKSIIKIKNDISISKNTGCINSIFNIIEDGVNGIHLLFKRVKNFNLKLSQEMFVKNQKKNDVEDKIILQELITKYNLSEDDAIAILNSKVEKSFNKRDIETKNSSGFNVYIVDNVHNNELIIDVYDIDNILYLQTLPLYIDTLIRISQADIESTTNYSVETINKLCLETERDIIEGTQEESPENIVQDDEIPPAISQEEENNQLQDEDQEDEEEVADIFDLMGGAKAKKKEEDDTKITYDGVNYQKNKFDKKSLSNPYYFQKRLEDNAKVLFASFKDKSYSRMCKSNTKQQPVILNKAEVDEIKTKYPDMFGEKDIINYSSNPQNKEDPESFYYACPRYWCLLTNKIISDEDVKAGKCGKVLPQNAKEIIPDHYVYEFTEPKSHVDENGEYIKYYPGFHAELTENNQCIPCCYKRWDTDKQIKQRNKCLATGKEKESVQQVEGAEASAKEEEEQEPEEQIPGIVDDQYIKNAEKFPLDPGRWGYLPISIQMLFNQVGIECKNSSSSKSACMLRHGVEFNKNKSFISCIADAIFYAEHDEDKNTLIIPPVLPNKKNKVKSMVQLIIDAINIDLFITYQNASLADSFYVENNSTNAEIEKQYENVNEVYQQSELYKKSSTDVSLKRTFINIMNSFDKFKEYLLDENVLTDHTYLWDIISLPNPQLFEKGINLIILNIPDNDITNNVDFICPTNHYSSVTFHARKRTLFLIRRDNLYEPMYEYKDKGLNLIINKTFSEYDKNKVKYTQLLFTKIIKPIIQKSCAPLPSTAVYKYQHPVLLEDLIKELNVRKYTIQNQVMNYRGKIIGVTAIDSKDKNHILGFLPCYPASADTNYDYIYVTQEDEIWNTYENTYSFLYKWFKIKKTDAATYGTTTKCTFKDSFCKVIEDEFIVGFITNTNQFIKILPPIETSNISDNLRVLNDNNYLIADDEILSTNKMDQQRINYMNNIKLEYNFYNVFRNTIRILINDYMNREIQEQIKNIIKRPNILYNNKLKMVKKMVIDLVENKIEFVDDFNPAFMKDISTCIGYTKTKCGKNAPLCMYKKNSCMLMLPKQNLINKSNNEDFYFTRIVDELVRYNRINSFFFQTKNYLSFENINYNLNKTEIIILQSLLTQEYFDKLNGSNSTNKYITNNTYDMANASYGRTYSTEFKLGEDEVVDRTITKNKSIKSVPWRHCFPENSGEIVYSANNYNTLQLVIDILNANNIVKTREELKNDLSESYSQYAAMNKPKLLDIIYVEGKRFFSDGIRESKMNIKDMVYFDNYYLTNFDIRILLDKYKIPSFFISPPPRFLLETNYNDNIFTIYSDDARELQEYVFIVSPPINIEEASSYKVIEFNNKILINLADMKEGCLFSPKNANTHKITIEHYINVFSIDKSYIKKKSGLRANPFNKEIEQSQEQQEQQEQQLQEEAIPQEQPRIIQDLTNINPEKELIVFDKEKKKKTRKNVRLQHNKND